MQFIIGLGNPETSFAKTRHNVGFEFLNWFAKELQISFSFQKKLNADVAKIRADLLLCKPQTYMNLSGQAVQAVLKYFSDGITGQALPFLTVVHDDLDLTLGSFKIQFGTGPKKHNGLLSIYQHLQTDQFWHVRIGIENRGELRPKISGEQYVLQPFASSEQVVIRDLFFQIGKDLSHKLELS